jgi:hypothetical protein
MKLSRTTTLTEAEELQALFKNKSFTVEYAFDGKIKTLYTKDQSLITWAKSKGLSE